VGSIFTLFLGALLITPQEAGGAYICSAEDSNWNMEIQFSSEGKIRRLDITTNQFIDSDYMESFLNNRLFQVRLNNSDDLFIEYYLDKDYLLDWYDCSISAENNSFQFLLEDGLRHLENSNYEKVNEIIISLEQRLENGLSNQLILEASRHLSSDFRNLLDEGLEQEVIQIYRRYSSSNYRFDMSFSEAEFLSAIRIVLDEEIDGLKEDKFNFNLISTFTILDTLTAYTNSDLVLHYAKGVIDAYLHHGMDLEAIEFLTDTLPYYIIDSKLNNDYNQIYSESFSYYTDSIFQLIESTKSLIDEAQNIGELVEVSSFIRFNVYDRVNQLPRSEFSLESRVRINDLLNPFYDVYLEYLNEIVDASPIYVPYDFVYLMVEYEMDSLASNFIEDTLNHFANTRNTLSFYAFLNETAIKYYPDTVPAYVDRFIKDSIDTIIEEDDDIYAALYFIDDQAELIGDTAYSFIDYYTNEMINKLVLIKDWESLVNFSNDFLSEFFPEAVQEVIAQIPQNEIPTILLNGNDTIYIYKDSVYEELGIEITSGPIAQKVTLGTVNTSISGEYLITYYAISDIGVKSLNLTRKVIVLDYSARDFLFSGSSLLQGVDSDLTDLVIPSYYNEYSFKIDINEIKAYAFWSSKNLYGTRIAGGRYFPGFNEDYYYYTQGDGIFTSSIYRNIEGEFFTRTINDPWSGKTFTRNIFSFEYPEINDPFDFRDISADDGARISLLDSLEWFSPYSIRSLILSNGLNKIGEYAFSGNQLEILTIPASVNEIGLNAFAGNPLKEVNFNGVEYISREILRSYGIKDSVKVNFNN